MHEAAKVEERRGLSHKETHSHKKIQSDVLDTVKASKESIKEKSERQFQVSLVNTEKVL